MKRFLLIIGIITFLFFFSGKLQAQTITASAPTGSIAACTGTASLGYRQFTVAGSGLTAGITVTAPLTNFEVSLSPGSGYGSSVTLPQSGGTVYIRAAAGAATGDISGNVTLASAGATTQNVPVTGFVNVLPTVDPSSLPSNPTYANGALVGAINFTGTANTYTWTNLTTPDIGIGAGGTGNIPAFTAVNTTSSQVTAHIRVTPYTAPIAYVANKGDGTVSVINTATNQQLITPIAVGSNPIAVSASPDGSLVYVTNNGTLTIPGTISVINTITNTVTAIINLGPFPFPDGLVVSPDGSRLYVANNVNAGTVSIINTATNTLLSTINVGVAPYGITISLDGNHVYVSNTGSATISDINVATNTVTNITVGTFPNGLVVSPDGSRLYVANQDSKSVSVINTSNDTRILPDIAVGNAPVGVALSPDGGTLYVTNANDNNVMVFNTANNGLVATIPVGATPYGISITPDGSQVYVTNQGDGTVSDINTQTNAVTTFPVGSSPYSFGNFIKAGVICSGPPADFTITVTPVVIIVGTVTGNITACVGTASVNPDIQQFTVAGSSLSADIIATAPQNFEISLTASGGYGTSVTLPQSSGTVNSTIIYVRSAASAPSGNIAGNVTLTSGRVTENAAVTGVINALPTVDVVSNQIVTNGVSTTAITFGGTAATYTWINDNPNIGLASSGTGDIASFTAVNTGNSQLVATITVTPEPAPGVNCNGSTTTFTITVNPSIVTPTSITASAVSGSISACAGTVSASPNIEQFTVSGNGLSTDITASTPTGFEISLTPGSDYSGSVTIAQSGGSVTNTVLYVRSAASDQAGNIAGNVTLISGATSQSVAVTGIVNALSTVNVVSNQIVSNGQATGAVNFTGTVNSYSWVNDTPGIGLATSGTGDIASFTATNTGNSPIVATITVTPEPAPGVDCTGSNTTFTITVNPTIPPSLPTITASAATGNISACEGSTSSAPNIQQFTVSGNNLTTDITATAPQNFEISLSADDGYSNSLTIPQAAGTVNNTVVYVRSSAAAAGIISGKVTLTSTGAADQTVDVTGIVNESATVNAVSNQTVADGAATTAINFTGTANTFNWFNDVPGIGLAASGSGNIPSFTSVNTTISAVTATITVVPVNAGGVDTGCDGAPVTFTITVNPSPLAASVVVPNAFTPNNDGVNDTWNIKNIYLYPNNTVDIFNRYGQKVYSTINYGTPWDGTYKGETLPTGTYYYVIDLKNGTRALSGYVALIR